MTGLQEPTTEDESNATEIEEQQQTNTTSYATFTPKNIYQDRS